MGIKLAPEIQVKRSAEVRKVNFDFEDDMAAGATVSSVSSTAVAPTGGSHTLSVDGTAVSGTNAQATISGGGIGELSFTGADSTDTLTATSHNLTDGDTVQVIADATDNLPGGLSEQVTYYVVSAATSTLKLALVSGGDPVPLTSDGQGKFFVEYTVSITVVSSNSQTLYGEGRIQVRD